MIGEGVQFHCVVTGQRWFTAQIMDKGFTWLTVPKLTKAQRLARYFFLVNCLSGLVLKVLIQMAAEAKTTLTFLRSIKNKRDFSYEQIGAIAILSRQGYAKMAQNAAHAMAKNIDHWTAAELRNLEKQWAQIEKRNGKKHGKKIQGRSGPFFGALWIRKLLKAPRWKKIWKDACVEIGRACADPNFDSSFKDSCKVLSKLKGFGIKYGAKHMIRSAYIYRHWVWDLDDLLLEDRDWADCMAMNEDTTKKGFRSLGVETMPEAEVMKGTLSEAMSAASTSTATQALYRRMQLIELPCKRFCKHLVQ